MSVKRKLYVYVDESGQDTGGILFVVSIVILEEDKEALIEILEAIEKESGKRNQKWRKTHHKHRKRYLESLMPISELKDKVFFETFMNTKKYLEMTSYATARSIIKKSRKERYTASIYIDGLKKQEIIIFSRILGELNINRRKVAGVKRDENNPLIRLADAVCGLVRDAKDGNEWAEKFLKMLIKKGIAYAL